MFWNIIIMCGCWRCERYFTKGYHEQHIRPNTVTSALHYLMAYDYQAYHGEAAKKKVSHEYEKSAL